MRVVVMEDYQRAVERLDCLRAARRARRGRAIATRPETVAERAAQIGDAEALVLIRERTPIDAARCSSCSPTLRLICQTGRGMPHIDLEACTARGIVGLHRRRVAVGAGRAHLALILAVDPLHRRATPSRCAPATWQTTIGPGAAREDARDRRLRRRSARSSPATDARSGCTCSPWGRAASLERAAADGFEAEPISTRSSRASDVVSLHLKLTPETRGIVTARHSR